MLRGVRQMRELVIRYSDYDGSSKGIREWIQSDLVKFASENQFKDEHTEKGLVIKTDLKRNFHPCIRGHYLNGNVKTIGLKNLSKEEIGQYVYFLRNQIGRRMGSMGYKKPVVSRRPSIQGIWNESMDLIGLPLEIIHRKK
eukprot:gene24013-32420_t